MSWLLALILAGAFAVGNAEATDLANASSPQAITELPASSAAGTADANSGSGVAAGAATAAGSDDGEKVSWLGRLGSVPISLLVIAITVGPPVGFSAYKRLEEQQANEDMGRRLWKVDASDTGDDSDGLD
mmetsp:Transcript_128952/g.321659  ORF Transcript_128952/g.321659 Transcript_128952/m.321659 type:complete len:130 (+) Transcript_128952:113-502(+)